MRDDPDMISSIVGFEDSVRKCELILVLGWMNWTFFAVFVLM